MKKIGLSNSDQEWLKQLGKQIEALIRERGYPSVYDFWVNKAGEHLSRASLNNLVTGKKDFRLTTVRKVAKLLGVKPSKLLSFD